MTSNRKNRVLQESRSLKAKSTLMLGRACMGACFFLCILKNAYPIALFNKANPRSVLSLPQTERAKNRV